MNTWTPNSGFYFPTLYTLISSVYYTVFDNSWTINTLFLIKWQTEGTIRYGKMLLELNINIRKFLPVMLSNIT